MVAHESIEPPASSREVAAGSGQDPAVSEQGLVIHEDAGQCFDVLVHLRWADEDSLGHINNVSHLRLLEEARIRFITALGYSAQAEFGLVAVRHEIDYLRPLHYSIEPIRIRSWLSRLGRASFTIRCDTYDQSGQVVARAATVVVATTPDGAGSYPWPDEARALLEPFLRADQG